MSTPAFTEPLYVGRPNIPPLREVEGLLGAAMSRRWLSNDGPLARSLEDALADRLGMAHCAVFSSGTAALVVVLRALDGSGPVVMPAFTFLGTARALDWEGFDLRFADINRADHMLDHRSAVSLASDDAVLLAVDIWGQVWEQGESPSHPPVVVDVAHSLGSSPPSGGRRAGAAALAGSLHATKIVSAGEGGFVATDDPALAARLRSMRNFGFSGADAPSGPGTNAKMSEVNAAFGLASLAHLDEYVAANRANYEAYRSVLDALPGVRLVPVGENSNANCQHVVIEVEPRMREPLVAHLEANNVIARRYFAPGCHRLGISSTVAYCPETDHVAARTVSLPTGTAVSPDAARRVGDLVAGYVTTGGP